jgi:hypothetical protein
MNMKIRSALRSALVAGSACAFCVSASIAQSDVEQRASQLRIYAFGEIPMGRYEVVGRPWTDSWRSAFWVPTFPSQEQAIAALQAEAVRHGADGLLNVNCLDQGHRTLSSNGEPAFLCYGIAIRVRPNQG